MARARNIKPSFFTNDVLVELDPVYRLLFIGLWLLADREGRLENRPKKIKMELFPADNIDVKAGLDDLQKTGFISLYNCYETNVIQINNFAKHQAPHGLEKDSDLPNVDGTYTTYKRNQNKTISGDAIFISREQWLESKGLTEKKSNDFRQLTSETAENCSETVLEHDKNALIPDSLNLIPDSLNLNTENRDPRFDLSLSDVNTRLSIAGLKNISQHDLNVLLIQLKDAYSHKHQMVKNQILGKAFEWIKRQQETPLAAPKQQSNFQTSQQRTANEHDRWRQAEQQAFGERDVTPKKPLLIEEVGHA